MFFSVADFPRVQAQEDNHVLDVQCSSESKMDYIYTSQQSQLLSTNRPNSIQKMHRTSTTTAKYKISNHFTESVLSSNENKIIETTPSLHGYIKKNKKDQVPNTSDPSVEESRQLNRSK